MLRQGRFAELAKVDIASAYQIMPVHQQDCPLLRMIWKGEVFVDTVLPFRLRSAPKVFTALADGLEWILRARGSCEATYYLDDYLFIGTSSSCKYRKSLHLAVNTCTELGIPLALEKQEGSAHQLVCLGIELPSACGMSSTEIADSTAKPLSPSTTDDLAVGASPLENTDRPRFSTAAGHGRFSNSAPARQRCVHMNTPPPAFMIVTETMPLLTCDPIRGLHLTTWTGSLYNCCGEPLYSGSLPPHCGTPTHFAYRSPLW